jgi:hypothetical protein
MPLDENVDVIRTIIEDNGWIGKVKVELPNSLPWFLEEKGDPGSES